MMPYPSPTLVSSQSTPIPPFSASLAKPNGKLPNMFAPPPVYSGKGEDADYEEGEDDIVKKIGEEFLKDVDSPAGGMFSGDIWGPSSKK